MHTFQQLYAEEYIFTDYTTYFMKANKTLQHIVQQ